MAETTDADLFAPMPYTPQPRLAYRPPTFPDNSTSNMATPSLGTPTNFSPLLVTSPPPPPRPPPSSSPPPPAFPEPRNRSAAADEIQDQPLLLPPPPAGVDMVVAESKEEDEKDGEEALKKEWIKEMRGWLMVLATLVASVTYSAGLNPPGGFWQDGSAANNNITKGHTTGNPVLADTSPSRYRAFFVLNAYAFAGSIVVIVLVLTPSFFHAELRLSLLLGSLLGSLLSLVGAFCAGGTRNSDDAIEIVSTFGFLIVYLPFCAWLFKKIPPTCLSWQSKKESSTRRPISKQEGNVELQQQP